MSHASFEHKTMGNEAAQQEVLQPIHNTFSQLAEAFEEYDEDTPQEELYFLAEAFAGAFNPDEVTYNTEFLTSVFNNPTYKHLLDTVDIASFLIRFQTNDTEFGLSLSKEAAALLQQHAEAEKYEKLLVTQEAWQALTDMRLKNEIRRYIVNKLDALLSSPYNHTILAQLDTGTIQKGDLLLAVATFVHQYGISQLSDSDFSAIQEFTADDANIAEQISLYQQDTSQSKQDLVAIDDKEKFSNFMEYLYFKFLHKHIKKQ